MLAIRQGLREQRWLTAEVVILAGICTIGFLGLLPFHPMILLLIMGILSLWLRQEGSRSVGLDRRPGWSRMLGVGFAAGIALQLLSLYAIEPLIARWTGRLPDVSLFSAYRGNWRFLVLSLVVSWTVAAIGEEFTYRGYLMRRFAQVLGSSRTAWLAALVITSALFGGGHLYQGVSGAISTGLTGLILGALYLACGRNLWVLIMAHGANDTIGFLLIFLGRYPGQ